MEQVRVGFVRYLNTAPLVEGLKTLRTVELSAAVPSRIVGMLASGEVDIGLASVIDALRSPVPLAILPVGMIGCEGPTLTVRVFSKSPIEKATRIYADTDSHTSVALCRVVMKRVYGVDIEIVDFDARERIASGDDAGEWPESMLLIGDKVVADSPPAVRYPHQLDLGQAWLDWTGLPFVYAVWMCREAEAADPSIAAAAAVLDRTRLHNKTRIDWIIRTHAPRHRWPIDLATRYLGELLRYDLGDREREGMLRFFDEARALGLAPEKTPPWVSFRDVIGASGGPDEASG